MHGDAHRTGIERIPIRIVELLTTLAIANYRSLLQLFVPLGALNVITGPNGSGKSNLYGSLRLLAQTAQGGVVNALAGEGGLESTLWAGPESISKRMRSGEVPVQGGPRQKPVKLRLGFASEDFGYSIDLGLPEPSSSAFALDPEIKRECIWAGPCFRPASLLVDRRGPVIKIRADRGWDVVAQHTSSFDSMFSQVADPASAPEVSSSERQYVAFGSMTISVPTWMPRRVCRNWVPAHRFCTMMAVTWRQRCRPFGRLVMRMR